MKNKRKLVIQCCSGLKNSGDEAILQSVVMQYQDEYEIYVISENAAYTQKMHPGINVCSGYRECCSAIAACDAFLLGGGGLLQDETTVYNVVKWLRYLRFALKKGKKTVLYANSIGPLNWKLNRRLVRKYLNKVGLITLRDEISAQLLEEIGVHGKIAVTADPVFSIEWKGGAALGEPDGDYVCMALRHWYDVVPFIPVSICNKFQIRGRLNRQKYENYIRVMAAAADYINEVWNKKVVFVSFLYGRDGKVARDILKLVNHKNNVVLEEEYMTPMQMMNIISRAQLLIGMRLHSIIYAICTNTPVLPVIYSSKVRGMVEENRLAEYSISMKELRKDKLIALLNKVKEESAVQKKILAQQYRKMREKEKENRRMTQETLSMGKKIVLIGPVYPYKGGISHYTSLMCMALREKYDVSMVSYKMQYPRLLFKKEQRDYSNDQFKVEGTKYWIHTANPINIVSSAHRIKALRPDLVIIQWWHPYFAPCYQILCRALGKCRIMFVCHNVFPHERFPLDRFLTKRTLKCGDYFLVQSGMDEADLLGIKKDARCKRVVHPTYNTFRFKNMSMQEAREEIGLSMREKVILFFGFVRKYKGLHHLLDALPMVLDKLPDVKLLVVGDFGDDKEEYLKKIEEKKLRNYLVLVQGYCPDTEVEKYFAASNLVALPYESATQSGIAQIAFGFDKPIVATDVGGLPEVITDRKTGYIVPPENAEELASAIIRFFAEDREKEFIKNIKMEAERFSWETMVKQIEALTGLND